MRPSVQAVHRLVTALEPWDELEARDRTDALRWLDLTDDVSRRIKPGTPDPHLVSYVVMTDQDDGSTLLVDHISADRSARSWTQEEVLSLPAARFDPHYRRFLAKMTDWCRE